MGDMKNSLKAKAARNLDNLVHRADSPFIPSIADFPLPSRFKVPLLENFDGTKDPFDYLEAFKTIMQLQAIPKEVIVITPFLPTGFSRVSVRKTGQPGPSQHDPTKPRHIKYSQEEGPGHISQGLTRVDQV